MVNNFFEIRLSKKRQIVKYYNKTSKFKRYLE